MDSGHAFKRCSPSEINLIPYINFMIVLIPILMISAEFSHLCVIAAAPAEGRGSGPKPQVKPFDAAKDKMDLLLVVTDSAVTATSQSKVIATVRSNRDLERLLENIANAAGGAADSADIIIAAENNVLYDRIVQIMDLARSARFTNIAIARLRA